MLVELLGLQRRELIRIEPHVLHKESIVFGAGELGRIGGGRDLDIAAARKRNVQIVARHAIKFADHIMRIEAQALEIRRELFSRNIDVLDRPVSGRCLDKLAELVGRAGADL
ncbi:hypothetical protein EOB59_31965 [Mesorhizobium sp. M7A.F.Ca.MR.176.00.0.0]|nr:hypothetical protein EOB59_31965 [Mesorhizobium sp. M7A.F.Ca.MR.176.00.0.0]